MPYPGLQAAFDALYPKGLQWYWRADFVDELSDEAIERHPSSRLKLPTMHSTMHLYPIDGAVHDVAPDDTAFGYRDCKFAQVIVGVDPDPANGGRSALLARRLLGGAAPALGRRRLREHDDGRGDRARAGELRRQLRAPGRVKAAYDPDNVFRVNQNIVPA